MKKIIIFDLDGTLANTTHRQHFLLSEPKDWNGFNEACDGDTVIEATERIFSSLALDGTEPKILIWTGRKESVRDKTQKWLDANQLFLDGPNDLRMRPSDNLRPEPMLKEKWLKEVGPENVLCAFETRKAVVEMYRSYGVPCFQLTEQP